MARYEFSEGSSNKFWEIRLEGASVITTYGRIGTDGQSTMKDFDTEEQARKEHDKLIASKVQKGYQAVDGGAAVEAKPAKAAKEAKPAKTAKATKAAKPTPKAEKTADDGAQRFELSEGSSNKFWVVRLEGSAVITTYGRIGSEGQSTMKELDNLAEAEKERDKLIASKVKKGYERV
jgi:predicted DNA-binding WGR domain protein